MIFRKSVLLLGLAMASTSALAGVYMAPADRAARQAEAGRRGQESRGSEQRGSDQRGSDQRRDERRLTTGPVEGRREGSRDGQRRERDAHDFRSAWRGDRSRDRDQSVLRASPAAVVVSPRFSWNDSRRPAPQRGSAGWRDERGRQWQYSRDWYERYRSGRFRYDREPVAAALSVGIYIAPRIYAPRYWARGQWLPAGYYADRRYRLTDYGRFDLYDPPFGAGWVRVDSDALLIDISSGEVLEVVYSLFW